jgi:hypothetical protein
MSELKKISNNKRSNYPRSTVVINGFKLQGQKPVTILGLLLSSQVLIKHHTPLPRA